MAGKTDGEWFEGYPLEVSARAKKTASAYTIFGNTNSSAKGVGTEIVQLVGEDTMRDSFTYNGITFTKKAKNVVHVQGTATGTCDYNFLFRVFSTGSFVVGHKYILIINNNGRTERSASKWYFQIPSNTGAIYESAIITYSTSALYAVNLSVKASDIVWDDDFSLSLFDLTATFGAGNEPTSVSDFLSRLGVSSLPYLPFGSTYHIGVVDGSRNLWDEEWQLGYWRNNGTKGTSTDNLCCSNPIKVTEGQIIYVKCGLANGLRFYSFSSQMAFVSDLGYKENGNTFVVPNGVAYLTFYSNAADHATTYNHNICINYTDSKNGQYSPYFISPKKVGCFLSAPLCVGCSVDNKGKYTNRNLWDEEWELGRISSATGANETSTATIRTKNYIPIQTGIQYYCKSSIQTNVRTRFYDASFSYIGYRDASGSFINYNSVFTPPANASYVRIEFNEDFGTTYNHDVCFNVSDSNNGTYSAYLSGKATMPKLGVQKGDNVITADTEVKPTKIKAKI